MRRFFNQMGNSFISLVLRTPLHGLLSVSILLITVKGRKTGQKYTTPVNYLRQGDVLTIVSLRTRTWWRNLRSGHAVTLRLRGRDVIGRGDVIEDEREVGDAMAAYIQQVPNYARYFNVTLDGAGQPNKVDVDREARSRVVIRVKLESSDTSQAWGVKHEK